MKRMTVGLVAGIVFWVATSPVAQAQQQDDGRVLLSIEVTDSKGHYINGLQPKDFRILEDGIVQELRTLAEKENAYNVTYLPAPNPNEGFRKIEIRIVSDVLGKYRVRSKPGYRPRR